MTPRCQGTLIYLKSDNLQYNTLVCWDKWLADQASDVTSIIFFIISCKIVCKNGFNFYFIFCKVIKKIERIFLQRILQEIMKKIILGTSDAWLMRRSSQRPSILYWRLSDFWGQAKVVQHFFLLLGIRKKNRYLVFIIDPILFIFFLRNQKFYVKFEFCFVNSRRLDGLMQHLLHSCFRKCNAIFLMRHLMFI